MNYEVIRVLIFTDIEDKAITEAKKQEKSLTELTDKVAKEVFQDFVILKIKTPTHNPRSSTCIDQAVHIIKVLLEKGYAYWDNEDVLFDPLKFNGFGRLFGLDMSRWPQKKRRFRKDTYSGLRWNLGDFILWHGCKKNDEYCWETEIGKGRPAWNIQDASAIMKELGPIIDVSCGGIDNLYRHHDYTIAIIEAISGQNLARYWLHGEHLLINGKKMSKSRGNVIYVDSLLSEGYDPRHIRFFLIYEHYRKNMNFTWNKLILARKKLDDLRVMVLALVCSKDNPAKPGIKRKKISELIDSLTQDFEKRMNNDLDVYRAFNDLCKNLEKLIMLRNEVGMSEKESQKIFQALNRIDGVLQVIF
jgi:cysteinyl-tRNA synthetase